MSRASLEKTPSEVAAMFDGVAEKYDLTNTVLALRQDRRWRRVVNEALDLHRGEKALDLAAGTGTSSEPFVDAGVLTVPCDFSLGMLKVGRRRRPDMPSWPVTRPDFRSRTGLFDAVTISFGLRNVVDVDGALREMLRVTRPGGRIVVCEFSHPTWAPFRTVYTEYLMRALPRVARTVSSTGCLRLPGRVHPGLAEPGRAGPEARRGRLGRGRLPQPDRRNRRPPPRHPPVTPPGSGSGCELAPLLATAPVRVVIFLAQRALSNDLNRS